jgi:hypothetical protein
MRSYYRLVALSAALAIGGGAAAAAEKPDQPKERKVCRTVEVSGRITPRRICRKVERPAAREESQRESRESAETAKSGD